MLKLVLHVQQTNLAYMESETALKKQKNNRKPELHEYTPFLKLTVIYL